jgi:hypothetical protein
MNRYLVSFDDGAMQVAEDELAAVSAASHEVVRAAREEGVFITGAGLATQQASIVAPDGTVTDGPFPETKAVLGGFVVLEVSTRDEALAWAARFAEACRCPQEVRELLHDPLL